MIVPSFHCSWAALLVVLDGEACAAAPGRRLSVSSVAGAACRRPGGHALLSARGWVLNPLAGSFCAAAGFLLRGSRVNELLNALRHGATLVALEVVELISCLLGGSYVLRGRGVDRAVYPEYAGDRSAALPDRADAAGPASSRHAANSAVDLALVGL